MRMGYGAARAFRQLELTLSIIMRAGLDFCTFICWLKRPFTAYIPLIRRKFGDNGVLATARLEKGCFVFFKLYVICPKMFAKRSSRKGQVLPVVKSFLFALLGLTAFSLAAQTTKGSWLIGGNAYARYEADSGPKGWNINMNPMVGYFLGTNFALGLGVPWSFTSRKNTGNGGMIAFIDGQQVEISRTAQLETGLALLIRGYIGGGRFRPFLQAQPGFSRQVYKTEFRTIPKRRYLQTSAAISGGPGLSYFITDHVGVEALVNAVYNDDVRNFPPTSIGLYFGLQFYLPKK
jgi:hypothetical protein